jgi:hypothetical protein
VGLLEREKGSGIPLVLTEEEREMEEGRLVVVGTARAQGDDGVGKARE